MEVVKSDCKYYSKPTHWNSGEESCNLRDDWFIPCENCPHYDSKNRRTNADKIRSMSDEELAEWKEALSIPPGADCRDCKFESCTECWLDWLKQEAEGGE